MCREENAVFYHIISLYLISAGEKEICQLIINLMVRDDLKLWRYFMTKAVSILKKKIDATYKAINEMTARAESSVENGTKSIIYQI